MGVHMTPDDHNQIWDLVEAGESHASIGKMIGRRRRWFSLLTVITRAGALSMRSG